MNRKVYCVFLNKISKGLEIQPYPGKLGKNIYNNISQIAWNKWQQQQTILINEKKLNLINKNHRNFLEQEMVNFLFCTSPKKL